MFHYLAFAGRPGFVSVAAKPVNNRCVGQKWSTIGNEAGKDDSEFVEVCMVALWHRNFEGARIGGWMH